MFRERLLSLAVESGLVGILDDLISPDETPLNPNPSSLDEAIAASPPQVAALLMELKLRRMNEKLPSASALLEQALVVLPELVRQSVMAKVDEGLVGDPDAQVDLGSLAPSAGAIDPDAQVMHLHFDDSEVLADLEPEAPVISPLVAFKVG